MLFFVFVFKCSLGEINMYILMQSNNCSAIKSIFMIQFFFFWFFLHCDGGVNSITSFGIEVVVSGGVVLYWIIFRSVSNTLPLLM